MLLRCLELQAFISQLASGSLSLVTTQGYQPYGGLAKWSTLHQKKWSAFEDAVAKKQVQTDMHTTLLKPLHLHRKVWQVWDRPTDLRLVHLVCCCCVCMRVVSIVERGIYYMYVELNVYCSCVNLSKLNTNLSLLRSMFLLNVWPARLLSSQVQVH